MGPGSAAHPAARAARRAASGAGEGGRTRKLRCLFHGGLAGEGGACHVSNGPGPFRSRLVGLAARSVRALPVVWRPFVTQGARERRVLDAPWSRAPWVEWKTRTRGRGTGYTQRSRTQWFTAYRALSSERSCSVASVAPRIAGCFSPVEPNQPPRGLTPVSEAPGPHAFAVRVSIVRPARRLTAHGEYPPCNPLPAQRWPRPPPPIPRS